MYTEKEKRLGKQGNPLLIEIDLLVPFSPDLGRGEHAA